MQKSHSLLNQIKSNYILEKIFSFAFSDIKSTKKLIKYNKNLFKRLNINIKDSFEYETRKEIYKKNPKELPIIIWFKVAFILFPFLLYLIIFYAKGKFNSKNLKEKYNKKKKGFVDFMDNYLLLIYIGLNLSTFLFNYILNKWENFAFKGYIKVKILLTYSFFDLLHYILYIIKFDYTKKLLDENNKNTWFYKFDIAIIVFMTFYFTYYLPFSLFLYINSFYDDFYSFGDHIYTNLYKVNGINIYDFSLPSDFDKLDEKEKNKIVFKNMESYQFKLNTNQIDLIKKINNIRKKNNVNEIDYKTYEKIPNFIINNPLDIHFYPNKKFYKLSGCCLFKYPKNEFEKHLNDEYIFNIIIDKNSDEINIIEQNNFELITIYNKSITSKSIKNNIKENNNYIKIEVPLLNIHHSEEEFIRNISRSTISEK